VAALTALLATVSFGVAINTPPRTGPFVPAASAIPYPYSAAVRYVPGDFVWMYPALLMMLAFLVLAVCLQLRTPGGGRLAGTVGLCLGTLATAVIALDHFVQLQVVQPSLVAGEGAAVAVLSQYNPHGVFIALEDLGFLALALSFGCFALTLGSSRLERATRWVLLAASGIAVVVFVGTWLAFGLDLQYRFEVAIISIDWITLIAAGTMLAFVFAKSAGVPTNGEPLA
jgi:hypothetical protein